VLLHSLLLRKALVHLVAKVIVYIILEMVSAAELGVRTYTLKLTTTTTAPNAKAITG
jgi:hypothetical protein